MLRYLCLAAAMSYALFATGQHDKWTDENILSTVKHLNDLLDEGEYNQATTIGAPLALAIKANIKTNHDTVFLDALEVLGCLYYDVGNYQESHYFYSQLAQKSQNYKNGQNQYLAISLNSLGIIYSEENQANKALECYNKALAARQQLNQQKTQEYLGTLNNIGILHKELGQIDSAEYYYYRALNLAKSNNDTINNEYIDILNNIAILYSSKGDYESGKYFISQAEIISNKVWGEIHPETARLHIEMGFYCYRLNEMTKAERYFRKGITVLREKAGEESDYYINAITGIAFFHQENHQYPQAIGYFREAQRLEEKYNPHQHNRIADVLLHMGQTYLLMGEYNSAKLHLLAALNHAQKAAEKSTPYEIETYNSLAQYALKNEPHTFWPYLIASLNKNCQLQLTHPISPQNTLPAIAQSHPIEYDELMLSLSHWANFVTEKQPDQAYQISLAALDLLEKELTRRTNETSRLALLQQYSQWADKALALGLQQYQNNPNPQLLAQLQQIAEGNKAKLLLKNIHNQQFKQLKTVPEFDSIQTLGNLYEQLRAKHIASTDKTTKQNLAAQLNSVNLQIKALQRTLEQKYPQATQFQQPILDIPAIQKLLPQNAAILLYHLGEKQLLAFYIDATTVRVHTIDNHQLSNQANQLRRALTDYTAIFEEPDQAYQNYTRPARWFYTQTVEPLQIPKHIQQLVIIPDGVLAHLPFETFLSDNPPTNTAPYNQLPYLIRQYQISYNYSASLWAENISQPLKKNNGQMLAMAANYSLKGDSSHTPHLQRLRHTLAPLPQAEAEIKALSAHYDGYFAFGADANEDNFKRRASQYNIIHLAMHGMLDNEHPVLSSLAFSADNNQNEDGFLQAYEIATLRLNANLIVLSACETGYGRFARGEGTLSLARAFMYAGANSLLVSMWEVNDAITSALMAHYYYHLQLGKNKAEALQAAKLTYLSTQNNKASHPAFWAPFVQYGDLRPIQQSSYFWYYISAAAAATLILLAYLKLKITNIKS